MAGYHLRDIDRGVYGEYSKVREEFEEMGEALEQGNVIMALVEASDLIGAIGAWARNNGSSLDAIVKMKEATERAFESGHRTASPAVVPRKPQAFPVQHCSPPLCEFYPDCFCGDMDKS